MRLSHFYMDQDLIMPISELQHRVTAGTYQNKLHDNIRRSTTQAQNLNSGRSAILDEIRHVGSSINRVVSFHEGLSRPQTTSPRQGIAAPLLMLLSQVRLDGIPVSSTTDIPAFSSERGVSPSVSRNAPHSDNTGSGFSTVLSPVTNAIYETGQFIARNDPLKFPVANASPVPLAETESTTVAGVVRDSKGDSYIITGEQKKNELISSLVKYLVSDGQMTADEGKDVELWLRSEAAGMPMVAARLDNEEVGTTRTKRALLPEYDPRTGEHIKEHCAFEEEVLTASGENEGKLLLFHAQRAEEPFRMIFDNREYVGPSPADRGIARGLDISTNILTFGIKPLIGNMIAHAKRREYYQNQGDEICAERYRRMMVAEVLTSLDEGGLSYQTSSRVASRRVKPLELLHASPAQERAAFYTRNPHTGIRKEILLELKQGKGVINDSGRQIFLKPTKKPNEFVTHYPHAMYPERLERRVIVDENNLSWRYADSFDSSGLNVDISEGKRQIKLHGENYELHQNAGEKYEIVVNKPSGVKEYIPVYMEPLSRTWHLSTHNEHAAFSNKRADIIKEIKVKTEEGFDYIPRGNNNQKYYGGGNIYVQEKRGNSGHYPWGRYVEMNGELVPVRNTQHQGQGILYEVYNMKHPEKAGHPIEWDGNRWLFERKTSVHVSKDLKNLISPEMIAEKVDAGKLSAPDHQGLRYDVDGNGYIKIDGQFIRINKDKQNYFIKKNNGGKIYIKFNKNKFSLQEAKVVDKFDARKLANVDISKISIHSVTDHKNMYVTDNGNLYIKLNNEHYPVEFMGRDKKVILIGSPNEIRLACIYNQVDGSIKSIGEHLEKHTLKYNDNTNLYISKDIKTNSEHVMRIDKDNLVGTNAVSVRNINKELSKIEFENFELYIHQKNSRDVYLAGHAGLDIDFSSKIPDNIELKFYTEKGKVLNGHVDDLQDLVNGKFNVAQTKKGGERVEAYTINFDHDSQINYANLARKSNKNIIKVKESGEVTLKNLLRDISSVFVEDKTLHLYMCRSF